MDETMFVQFTHPGSEHRPDGEVMAWNRRPHARKFLLADGRYLVDGATHDGPVTLWGEWEPPSRVVETFPASGAGPRWLHDPFWERPRHRALLQNTDPLTFGDAFWYTNCLQRNSKLRRLAPGSTILFGSRLEGEFVLDTVFVVGTRGEAYTRGSAASIEAPEWIRTVVYEPLAASAGSPLEPFRRYSGQMQVDSPAGPFSYVPCLPYRVGRVAFVRPTIDLDRRWLAPSLGRGARAVLATPAEMRSLWDEVAAQVTAAGLALAVRLEPPVEAPGGPSQARS